MSEVIAQTERLVLRRWRPDDLKLWLEHLNTDEVTDHLGGPRSPEVTAKRFQEMSEEWDKRGYSFLAAESRSTGMFLGACGLTTIDVPKAPAELRGAVQIGWIFRTEAWGKGYATEAARAVLEIAFGRCGLERVYAQTPSATRLPARSWRSSAWAAAWILTIMTRITPLGTIQRSFTP
jgi:RimJ/RimL family protein N-acetyltransferase